MPTAETQPAGSTTLSSYDIVVLQMTLALADRTQLSVTLTPPIEGVFPIDVTLKSQIARGTYYRLAAMGSVSGIVGLDDGPAWLGRVGFVGQGCLDARCRSSVNLGASVILAGQASFFATGAGLVLRLSDIVALVAELDTLVPSGRTVADRHGIVAAGGLRLSGARWGVDLALYRSLEQNTTLPFLVGTYRFPGQ